MTTTPVWFESLTDSVYALGAAVREAQRAARAAELARDSYDLDRLRPVDGQVRIDGRDPGGVPFRPHDDALFAIGDVHREQAGKLRSLYMQSAMGYAYGTAWAILRVLDGQQPDAVQLGRTAEGNYVIPGELCPVPPLMPGLQRWNDYPKFVQAHTRWLICEEAALFAEYLDDQRQLSDHEAGELHEALDTATGVPDAAYAYGLLAESALRVAQHARVRVAR
ncbi:hypothetical protein OHA61_06200 [Streptomyces sp. NBC_00885]|uniref:hypothetical protein n=1 Tax=Streptomyces sp. NBC_00885 TaxID=2975857 RepID=UPI0038691153|nr:hypothetical protein OHA61_06200 [Streptomyces sp. NBC_00885]